MTILLIDPVQTIRLNTKGRSSIGAEYEGYRSAAKSCEPYALLGQFPLGREAFDLKIRRHCSDNGSFLFTFLRNILMFKKRFDMTMSDVIIEILLSGTGDYTDGDGISQRRVQFAS